MSLYKMDPVRRKELEVTAAALVAKGKGILAADESAPTIRKRFESIQVESREETRRFYRELLLSAPGIGEYISGVILFEETLRQSSKEGIPFPELLSDRGIIPGIKVDKGLAVIPGTNGEKVAQGLDGLAERLEAYRELGARFAKWRAVINLGDHLPSALAIEINAHALARYAALCQDAGLVPIVEPELLINGDHTLAACERATEQTLRCVFEALSRQKVILEGMLLKPSMVIPGMDCPDQAAVTDVAEATLRCLKRSVPAAVPGVVFLSGGQSPELATRHLNAMNVMGDCPWELSFSYGRALQEKTLKLWKGAPENVEAAQRMLLKRAKCNGAARYGKYTDAMELD